MHGFGDTSNPILNRIYSEIGVTLISLTVNVTKWTWTSQIYMVFTSYKYLRGGHERCQESKEFDCSPPSFLSSSQDHMCMSSNLACDGLPNCGQVS